MRFLLLMSILALVSGCGSLRFVVDVTAARDELTETIVLEDDTRLGRRAPKIAMIDVTGLIADARKPGLFGEGDNPVADLAEALKKAGEDGRVAAVLLRINSPGGTVTASDVMYRQVRRFRAETGKPVVVLMADLAASGGYYLACAADYVVAHPTTITGSIGVIIQTFNFSEGMRRIGIHADAITSGESKAVGSPFEPMQPAHREILQGLVDEFYLNFLSVVMDNREDINDAALEQVTDGRVVTGQHAYELGLVDAVGDLHDAYQKVKELAKLPAARLVKYHRPLQHVGSAYALTPAPPAAGASQINLLQLNLDGDGWRNAPGAYYLWDPALFDAR